MGGLCSVCRSRRETLARGADTALPLSSTSGLIMTEIPIRVRPERKASEAISILDPHTFEFVDALHLPKDGSSLGALGGSNSPSPSLASLPSSSSPSLGELPVRPSGKRNSLTAWLAGGLFSRRTSRSDSSGGALGRERPQLRPIKMLMSGAGESGKSTVIKQMKIIHQGGFSHEELLDFRAQIYRNIQESILQILDSMDSIELTRDERTLVLHRGSIVVLIVLM